MKTIAITATVVIGLLLGTGAVWAKQQCREGDGLDRHSDRMMEKMSQRLGLNPDQQAKLELFGEKLHAFRAQRKSDHKGDRQTLMDLLNDDTLDRDKALALMDERHQAFKVQMQGMIDAFADLSDSLAADQRAELKEMISQRMSRRRGGSHRRYW